MPPRIWDDRLELSTPDLLAVVVVYFLDTVFCNNLDQNLSKSVNKCYRQI